MRDPTHQLLVHVRMRVYAHGNCPHNVWIFSKFCSSVSPLPRILPFFTGDTDVRTPCTLALAMPFSTTLKLSTSSNERFDAHFAIFCSQYFPPLLMEHSTYGTLYRPHFYTQLHCCAILQPTAHYITTFLKIDTPQCVCVYVCVELDKADLLHNSESALFIT